MDLSPFKLDIDELINEYCEGNSTTLADFKMIWLSRKFSLIYEARPTINVAFFMQSLFDHSIGHMLSADSLSRRLGGLYCIYCLYQTQPFKPPFKVYLSLGALKRLKSLVVEAKKEVVREVPSLVKRMLESHFFLFGSVEMTDCSLERVNEISHLQDARIQVAYDKLLANTPVERFIHMDMDKELQHKAAKKISTEYAAAKELVISEGSKVVDIQNIKHMAENKQLAVDAVEKILNDWKAQKKMFNQQTRFDQHPSADENQVVYFESDGAEHSASEEEEEGDGFTRELEHLLTFD